MIHKNGYIKIVFVVVLLIIIGMIVLHFKKVQAPDSNLQTIENIQNEDSSGVMNNLTPTLPIHTSWKWISSTDYEGVIVRPQNSGDFILTISKEGRLSSTTDCNSISGSIIINDETLSVGPLISTKMACMGETLENKYSYDLSRAVSYRIENNILFVNMLQNIGVMQFEKLE